ncbi:hypothetical protein C820_000212 [Clostridium sp. MD294]|nr:hypothetical protein C820_000212 [Clostridium sp. MD294]
MILYVFSIALLTEKGYNLKIHKEREKKYE